MTTQVRWHSEEFEAVVRKNIARLLVRSAQTLQQRMKQTLSFEGSGIWYKGNPSRSSKPGEPPAPQTGALRRSVQYDGSRRHDRLLPRIRVGTNLKYGFWLEEGTSRGLDPRPWARPSMLLVERKIQRQWTYKELTRGYHRE